MIDCICCKSQAVTLPCAVSPPSEYHVPPLTVNNMYRKHQHHCSFKRLAKSVSSYISLLLQFCFFHLIPMLPLFWLSFLSFTPLTASLLLAFEVNHHLYYTALQLINNMLGRKKNNPHLLFSFSLLLFLHLSLPPLLSRFFLSVAKSHNKQAKNSELPRNPIWTPPWRLHGQFGQPVLE